MVGKDLAHEALTTSIEEIIRLNAAAVGISVFIGSDYESGQGAPHDAEILGERLRVPTDGEGRPHPFVCGRRSR